MELLFAPQIKKGLHYLIALSLLLFLVIHSSPPSSPEARDDLDSQSAENVAIFLEHRFAVSHFCAEPVANMRVARSRKL